MGRAGASFTFDNERRPLIGWNIAVTHDDAPLDTAVIAALYVEHGEELRRFLVGVLRDHQLAADVLQATFVKLVERGGETRAETRKSWLFRVAMNEALAVRRRDQVGQKVTRNVAWARPVAAQASDEPLIRIEAVEAVREALAGLPADQQRVVRMRIYEEKTFAEIARELGIPLGTALARMHAALGKMRAKLSEKSP